MPTAPFIPFSRPTITRAEIKEVADCLKSGWLATGPRSARFEEMLREYFSAPHALCCASATMGLWMALKALDLKPGDEVITSPMTFVATLNTIVLAGGKPVLVDVEPGTYNLDVEKNRRRHHPENARAAARAFCRLPVRPRRDLRARQEAQVARHRGLRARHRRGLQGPPPRQFWRHPGVFLPSEQKHDDRRRRLRRHPR